MEANLQLSYEISRRRMKTARLAGLLWLLSAITGGFGMFFIRSNLIVAGDAAATAANVAASEFLFRLAIVSSLFSQIFLFFLGLTAYRLFKEVDKALATTFLAAVMITVALAVMNALNNFGALMLMSQAEYLNAFTPAQLNAMVAIFFRLNNSFGQGLLEVFWVVYFFAFGLLIIRSGFLPRILGILLMITSIGFATNILTKFLIPQFYPAVFTQLAMTLGAFGTIPTIFWLLIKGAKGVAETEWAS